MWFRTSALILSFAWLVWIVFSVEFMDWIGITPDPMEMEQSIWRELLSAVVFIILVIVVPFAVIFRLLMQIKREREEADTDSEDDSDNEDEDQGAQPPPAPPVVTAAPTKKSQGVAQKPKAKEQKKTPKKGGKR